MEEAKELIYFLFRKMTTKLLFRLCLFKLLSFFTHMQVIHINALLCFPPFSFGMSFPLLGAHPSIKCMPTHVSELVWNLLYFS